MAVSLRSSSSIGASFLFAALLIGCQSKDPAKCTEAQSVVRKALDAGDFNLARQWREYAYKQCEDTAQLVGLDREVVERETAVQAKAAADAKSKQETAQLVKLFLDFVAQNRAAPDKASQAPVCDPLPEGAPQDSKERLCTAVRQVGGSRTFQVRYYEAEPANAVRFTARPDDPIDCQTIGGTVSKTWDVPATGGKTAKRVRCELTGALAGLTAVISAAAKADLHIVAPGYVAREPGYRVILEGP